MEFNIDPRLVFDCNRTKLESMLEKDIKKNLYKNDDLKLSFHKIVTGLNKQESVLFSSIREGVLLFEVISKRFKEEDAYFTEDNFAFIEAKGESYFVVVIIDGYILFDKEIEHDYEFDFVGNLLVKLHVNEDIFLIVATEGNIDDVRKQFWAKEDKELDFKVTHVAPFIEHIKPSPDTSPLVISSKVEIKRQITKQHIGAVVGVFFVLGAMLFTGGTEEVKKVTKAPEPFKKYTETLTEKGVNVKTRFGYLFNDIRAIETLTGWKVSGINVEQPGTAIDLINQGGSFNELQTFAHQYNYNITKHKEVYRLRSQVKHTPIMQKAVLVSVMTTLTIIEEAMRDWSPEHKIINLSERVSNGKWSEIALTIQLAQWTKHDLDTLGTIMNGQPIDFIQAKLTHNNNTNELSGNASFVIYGD